MVSVVSLYDFEKNNKIKQDYDFVREKLNQPKSSIWDDDECKYHTFCTKPLTTMAVVNGPNTLDEIVSAYKEIKSLFKEKPYNYKEAQHPFSFFRGTILQDYLNPYSPKCINKALGKKIVRFDKSLAETKLGKWIINKLGVQEVYKKITTIPSFTHTEKSPDFVEATVLKSKNTFGDLTARALLRTPKITVGVLTGLGAIHTAYRINEGENPAKEIFKSAVQVGTTLAGMGYLGAIGAKYGGAAGSLVGISAGTLLGSLAPKAVESVIQANF